MDASFWSTRTLTVVAAVAAISACSSDPTLSNNIKQQGPEVQDVPRGEFHRAGQACMACHNSKGPATEFTMAGTIFVKPADAKNRTLTGVDQAEVLLVDGKGDTATAVTNCVGNFFLKKSDFNPKYPVRVSVAAPTTPPQRQDMGSLIGRDGSCATCHRYDKASDSVGNVYITQAADFKYTPPDCPVDPNLTLPDLGAQ